MSIRAALTRGLAAFGALAAILLVAGFVLDVQSFDRTSGGHEPPYTSYTGEPIDWAALDVTADGMAYRGHVVNELIDCTNGMMSFEVFKLEIPFREFSPRALAVHKPRQACQERGFHPAFDRKS
jgi:hypothetical protein